MILYIGDHDGYIHALNCVKEECFSAIQLFPPKDDSKDKNGTQNKIHQLQLITDKSGVVYLVAIRFNKRKIALLRVGNPEGTEPKLNPLYFRFEEKVLRSAIKHKS